MPSRGSQFIGFTDFAAFERTAGLQPGESVWISPEITARISLDQVIASWNVAMGKEGFLKLEARAIYPQGPTKYFILGLWSNDPAVHPRQSVPGQEDAAGNVATDTLVLKQPCDRLQVRLTIEGVQAMKFLGLCLTDTKTSPDVLPPNQAAWGKIIEVPERSQMPYTNGSTLCSPTTVSMLLAYWAKKLGRPELDQDVPEIEAGLYDSSWKGTGNWPFNMAYAGSYPGLRAYVSRFSDVSELEDWIARGLPVGLSVCYNRLRGKAGEPSGHLVVCVGFTETGDAVINDPGTSQNVRKIFPRANLVQAWSYSHNTVYLVYPQTAVLPVDRFGHWEAH